MVTFLQNTQDFGGMDDTLSSQIDAAIISGYLLRPLLTKISWFKIGLLEKNYPSKVLNGLIHAANFHPITGPFVSKFVLANLEYLKKNSKTFMTFLTSWTRI